MLLWENKKLKFLKLIRMGLNPFKKFVSTGEIQENLDLVDSRTQLLRDVVKLIEKNENVIIPVIGAIGTGKTHLFWALKRKLYYYNTVYVSLENAIKKFYYKTYSEFIEEIGVEPLRNITSKLCNQWGALERKFGFFHVADIDKVRGFAYDKLSNKFEQELQNAFTDVITAITTHQLDPYKRVEAERWLLGELMDIRELSRLNIKKVLRKKWHSFIMLKFLIEKSKLGSVLFIDDFEKLLSALKPETDIEESEEIFDPSWLYGAKGSPESNSAKKTFKKILKLQEIRGIRIIITLNSEESLEDIKKFILENDKKLTLTLKPPIYLSNFKEDDMFLFYQKSIEYFLATNDLPNLLDFNDNTFFPLNEKILNTIYANAQGNPRKILKSLIGLFNEIIYSTDNIDEILTRYN